MSALAVSSRPRSLAELIAERVPYEGMQMAGFGALCLYRMTQPARVRKRAALGPRLVVVAQGRLVMGFQDGDVAGGEDHLMVLTGEATFETIVPEASPERPYLAVCIELPPDVVARTLLALFDEGPASGISVAAPSGLPAFVSPATPEITSALGRLILAVEDPLERKVVAPLVVEELVFRLLRTEAAAVMRAAVREGDASIERAIRFIRDNVGRPMTVEGVARHVGMSASHFAHRFTEIARVSPMRFVKQARLEAARELMVAESLRVHEAAARVGYESASHFTNDFKGSYGLAPTEYVRRVRGGA